MEQQEKLPTLNHGVDAPETFLPAAPTWYPWAIAAAIILILLLICVLIRIFRKPKATPPSLPKENFFQIASENLEKLVGQGDTRPLAEIAAHSSLAIRSYLAGSISEPALYETVEEFKARQVDLPNEAEELLSDLNEAKYSKSTIAPDKAQAFVNVTP